MSAPEPQSTMSTGSDPQPTPSTGHEPPAPTTDVPAQPDPLNEPLITEFDGRLLVAAQYGIFRFFGLLARDWQEATNDTELLPSNYPAPDCINDWTVKRARRVLQNYQDFCGVRILVTANMTDLRRKAAWEAEMKFAEYLNSCARGEETLDDGFLHRFREVFEALVKDIKVHYGRA
ncbi:hypothetical protein EDC01DRAFT_628428 [Geopyxis carbonaria]|nr:hypothetical protein EDC01DRAFT_628428 [Geopyxis carbonaria]